MTDDDQMMGDKIEVKRHRNSPKHSKATWNQVKKEFEQGSYKSINELADRYGINRETLKGRIFRGQWKARLLTVQNRIDQKIEEKTVDIGKEYLSNTFLRAKKYEVLIDKSIEQVGGTVEPGDLDAYTRSEARIHALALSALRLPSTVQPIDVTSGGKSLGSIVDAIAKLRDSNTAIDLTPEQVKLIGSMEVVD